MSSYLICLVYKMLGILHLISPSVKLRRRLRPVSVLLVFFTVSVCVWLSQKGSCIHRIDEFGQAIRDRNTVAVLESLRHGVDPNIELSKEEISGGQMLFSSLAQLFENGSVRKSQHLAPLILVLTPDHSHRPLRNTPPDILLVEGLLEHGAHVDAVNEEGDSALIIACAQGDVGIVRLLLNHGAQVDLRNSFGCFPLMYSQATCIPLLVQYGANVNECCEPSGMTPLMASCQRGDLQAVTSLLKHGSQINAKDVEGHTPLVFAVLRQNHTILNLLLSKGADANVRWGRLHQTSLIYAYKQHDTQTINLLHHHKVVSPQ